MKQNGQAVATASWTAAALCRFDREIKSARGLAHSKTWRNFGCTVLLFSLFSTACATAAPPSAVVKSEFIFKTAPFPSCHASTIAETRSGLVAAWFGGTAERNPDVCIYVSRNENGKWTAPQEVGNGAGFATNRLPTWNPVLFQPKHGPLLLFYKVGPSPAAW